MANNWSKFSLLFEMGEIVQLLYQTLRGPCRREGAS